MTIPLRSHRRIFCPAQGTLPNNIVLGVWLSSSSHQLFHTCPWALGVQVSLQIDQLGVDTLQSLLLCTLTRCGSLMICICGYKGRHSEFSQKLCLFGKMAAVSCSLRSPAGVFDLFTTLAMNPPLSPMRRLLATPHESAAIRPLLISYRFTHGFHSCVRLLFVKALIWCIETEAPLELENTMFISYIDASFYEKTGLKKFWDVSIQSHPLFWCGGF